MGFYWPVPIFPGLIAFVSVVPAQIGVGRHPGKNISIKYYVTIEEDY
jgi:hypothetical protein